MRYLPRHFFTRFTRLRHGLLWSGALLCGGVLGIALLVHQSITQQRDDFETGARIAHRLLSQRAVQHEAVLATLSLMRPALHLRLPAIYPQILQVQRRAGNRAWAGPAQLQDALATAERRGSGPRLAQADMAGGRFWIVSQAYGDGKEASLAYALEISLPLMVPWTEWPFGTSSDRSSAHAVLAYDDTQWTIHDNAADDTRSGELRRFVFRKTLASESQSFDLIVERSFRVADLPWLGMGLWLLAWLALLAAFAHVLRLRRARARAEELFRLGQVSRLNALGELAAGLAHELNQPLTAVLTGAQAASRLLADEPPEIETARKAMTQTAIQARRAADVVARLRRLIERPNVSNRKIVDLTAAVRNALHLLEPETAKRGIAVRLIPADAALIDADPVALEQIIHNLVSNAMHALEGVAHPALSFDVGHVAATRMVSLKIRDNGPGVAPDLADRLFTPFVSGRAGGLGIGLSLSETLAQEMGGSLRYRPAIPGAEFILELPAAKAQADAQERRLA